ncbi:MAG: peptidylprolyl isomerase, partial [Flavobacteriales bacterium CG_4_9_14_0_2_um_filter_35_242]
KLDDLHLQLKSASLNDSLWIRYSDAIDKIPFLKNENPALVLKKMNIIEKKDSLGLYLVAIKDVLNINDTAPISYVTPTIIEIILHKRELNLIKNLQETLTKDAIKKNEFEIFIEN